MQSNSMETLCCIKKQKYVLPVQSSVLLEALKFGFGQVCVIPEHHGYLQKCHC